MPQYYIFIFDTFSLMNVCRGSWHKWEKESTFTSFLEARCLMTSWMFFKPIYEQEFPKMFIPQKTIFSKAQPFSMWYVNVYAAISNLSLESGIIVSGLLSCNLLLGMTVSLHSWRQLLIMSDVEMIFPQSEHDISHPWISVHNSLWHARWKVHGSYSWNMFWTISCLRTTWLFSFRQLCVMHNSSP